MAEQTLRKRQVVGSNPTGGSMKEEIKKIDQKLFKLEDCL